MTDQRKIQFAPAGCCLEGFGENALGTASVPGRTQPFRRRRQYPSASANGSRGGDCTRWTTRAEAHATTTEQHRGDDAEASVEWLSSQGWMRGGQTCGASWLCVGQRAAGQECPGYGCGRTATEEHGQFTSARQEPRRPTGGTLRVLFTDHRVLWW